MVGLIDEVNEAFLVDLVLLRYHFLKNDCKIIVRSF
jgi:hypothetical protein